MSDTPKTPHPLSPLTEALRQTLTTPQATPTPDEARDMLLRQAQVLDSLLHTLVERETQKNFSRGYEEAHSMHWMALALRVQKQCADTVKAVSAIEYMDTLNNRTGLPSRPPPSSQLCKQTEENA